MTSGDADIGERILAEIEKAGGHRPTGCPWAAIADPFVRSVINAHEWRKDGELERRYGNDPPHALMLGLETYGRAMRAVQSHDSQKRIEDDKAKQQAAQAAQPQAPRGRRPAPTRR